MSKGFASSYRILLLATGLFVCFGGVAARLVWLHVVDRDSLLKTINRTRQQYNPEVARRGDILDARGGLLATSSTQRVLGVDPNSLRPQDEPRWPELAALIGMPVSELRRIFTTRHRDVPAAPAVALQLGSLPGGGDDAEGDESVQASPPDASGRQLIRWVKLREDVPEKLHDEILKLGIKGVYFNQVARRAYPNQQLASHVVGYVNKQQEAVTGIEAYADFYLRGQDGWRVGERDGRNRELPQFLDRRVPASDGYSVKLSIDTHVQDIVEQELAYIAATYEPKKASIIVTDPRDGFILAMANYPTFDPNTYNKLPPEEHHRMRNVAVADVYEPGSVFKIVAVAAALEERIASTRSLFDTSSDRISHRGRVVPMPAEDHRFPNPQAVTLSEVVAYSSNRGAAYLAVALGEERFNRYVRGFGFGRRLEFPVGGEVAGLLRPVKDWDPIDITRIAIGHSISSTVLQMHQAMSVIANDGVLLRPQVIREVRDAAGEVVFRYDRVELDRVVSPDTARTVARLLMGVATKEGTAQAAAIEGYDVAGKTGTTIKLMDEVQPDGSIKKVYNRKHHIASFVGFFPAGRPQVAISVIVDDADHKAPNGVAYGGKVAAPSFRRLGEQLIPVLNIRAHRSPSAAAFAAHRAGSTP